MQQRYSILSGIASSVISAVSAIVVVPVYLRYLGHEAYGILGLYTTIQSLMAVFDLGFSATINRELARARTSQELSEAGRMAHALCYFYWATGAAIAMLIIFASAWITDHWLNLKNLPSEQVNYAIALAGVSLGIRWPATIYQAVLLGTNRMVTSNLITIIMTLITLLGSMVLVIFYHIDLRGLFAWHATSGLLLAILLRAKIAKSLYTGVRIGFDFRQISRAWRLSTSMAFIGVIALIFLQMDKLILSRMLSLEDYAHYILATLLASGLYALVVPVFNAIYPKLSALTTHPTSHDLASTYRAISWLLASLLFPSALFLALYGHCLVQLWTSDSALASSVSPMLALLSIGSSLHGMMFMPYALALAHGASVLVLRINLILLLSFGPLIAVLTAKFGGIGAAWAWVILHSAYLLFGSLYTHQQLFPQISKVWLLRDVGIPGTVSFIIAISGFALTQLTNESHQSSLTSVVVGATTMLISWVLLLIWQWRRKSMSQIYIFNMKTKNAKHST